MKILSYREKEAFLILWILFYLHDEILYPDIMACTAGLCKRLHPDSSTYLRATVAWPSRIHRTISENHCESTSDVFHSATLILSCVMLSLYGTYKMISRYVWMWFAMIFADSSINTQRSCGEDSSMNLDVNVCKNQRRVCFIRGEEFRRVGRTIFMKWKMLLFAYIIII